jgi:hypothetical protein
MPRPQTDPPRLVPPPEFDPLKLPRHCTRQQLAEIHRHYFGPLSPRTLEAWDLSWRYVAGRAVCPTMEFVAEAQRRFDASPVIRGGRRNATQRAA